MSNIKYHAEQPPKMVTPYITQEQLDRTFPEFPVISDIKTELTKPKRKAVLKSFRYQQSTGATEVLRQLDDFGLCIFVQLIDLMYATTKPSDWMPDNSFKREPFGTKIITTAVFR